jgi:hypothetical protein
MVKASVNGQDTVSNHWDRVAHAIETASLILGQLVTLRVHKRCTSVRPEDDAASALAKHPFTCGSDGGVRQGRPKLGNGGWRDTRRGAGDTHLGPHIANQRAFLLASNLLMEPVTLAVVTWRRARELFGSSSVNKEYRS